MKPAKRSSSFGRILCAGCSATLLVACATDRLRREAESQLQSGQYEKALVTYDAAIARSPSDGSLIVGQRAARSEIAGRLLTQASNERRAGQFAQAEATLTRLLSMEPANERALALRADIARDQRQVQAIEKARQLVAAGQQGAALALVEQALRDSPRNQDLLSLQRRIESELRAASGVYGGARLAESRPVTLEFRDANLRMLLEALSRSTGVDFIIDKDVRPDLRVTVFLRNTRLDEALDIITNSNQLARKVLDPRTVLIYPNTPEKLREHQDLIVRAFFLSSVEAKQMAALMRTMLKIREPFVDDKLNLLVLRESPETIRLAERLISLTDVGEPEVMMEVEILEIKSTRLTELGIQYPETIVLTALPPAGSSQLTLGNFSTSGSQIGLIVPPVIINLRRETGDVNLLANPRVRAKNREKARVLVGDKLPVVTSTATATGLVTENVSYIDVGIKIEVEPLVSLDDDVSIRVNLDVSNVVDRVKTSAGGIAYTIGTRSATTTLRLRDGETQVLAGLISKDDRKSAKKIPGLGDLPVLGRLFSTQTDDAQRTEIVLAITPRIIRNIRRPDAEVAEFWSGSELAARLRPLTLPASVPTLPGTAPSATPPGVASSALAAPGAVAADARLGWKAPQTVRVDEVFDVEAYVDTARPLRGVLLQLQFDASHLELVEVREGGFLSRRDSAVTVDRTIDASAGTATVSATRASSDGVAGSGTLLRLAFKAKSAGEAAVNTISASPVAAEGSAAIGVLPSVRIAVTQ